MANTLYEYYQGKGQTLPSLQDRSKLYEQYGLGSASTYGGTAEQNIALLSKLSGQSTPSTGAYTYNQKSYAAGTGPLAQQTASTIPQRPVEPTPYVSQTPTGQNTLKALKDAGYSTDYQSLMKTYRDYGLENTYGAFTGSNEQYNALRQKAVEDTQQKISQYSQVAQQAQQAGYQPTQQIEFDKTGSVSTAPTEEFKQMTGENMVTMMDDIVKSIGTTDLAKLIQDFSGGELTTPELELSKEDRDAQLESLKSAAAQGLQNIQQSLAKRGMTFSGIRTQSEANHAADVLARESGINRDFAGRLIAAARQEQGRREAALSAAEDNYNRALLAQGYIFNPITNTIEKTMQREQFEYGMEQDKYEQGLPGKPVTQTVGGDMYTYDPQTQQWSLTIKGDDDSNGMGFNMKDFYSVVDKGKADLQQGESWENVWNRIKQQFPTISDNMIDNALGTSWREEGAYQSWIKSKKGEEIDYSKKAQELGVNQGFIQKSIEGLKNYISSWGQ